MMRRVMPAAIVVVVTNLAMLAAVRTNRSGEPDATVHLTERELRIVRTSERESVRRLELSWSGVSWLTDDSGVRDWLTEQKLATLHVGCTPKPTPSRNAGSGAAVSPCGLPRRVFVAFEFDGPAWAAHAERLRHELTKEAGAARGPGSRAAVLQSEIAWGSRLVAVDASLDAAALRAAHPDRTHYVILPATVTAVVSVPNASTPRVSAFIRPVTTRLVAPTAYNAMLSRFGPSSYYRQGAEPRYTVTLAVGRRYEPWITSITPLTP